MEGRTDRGRNDFTVRWEDLWSDKACVDVTNIKIFLRRGDSGDPGNDRVR